MNPDFTAMEAGEMLNLCGDNAMAWAIAFVQHVRKTPAIATDVDTVVGWFANAIERSSDVRRERARKATAADTAGCGAF